MVSIKEKYLLLNRHPEIREIINLFKDVVYENQRSAEEIILRDEDVMRLLGISKRTLQYMKSRKEIAYQDPPGQRDYYFLNDILIWLKKYRVESIDNLRRV